MLTIKRVLLVWTHGPTLEILCPVDEGTTTVPMMQSEPDFVAGASPVYGFVRPNQLTKSTAGSLVEARLWPSFGHFQND